MQKVNSDLVLKFSLCAVNGRTGMNLTQEDAAGMLGISVRCLQIIEKAARQPKFEVALRMSKLYGFHLSDFLDNVQLFEPKRKKTKKRPTTPSR